MPTATLHWANCAARALQGRRIVTARYMTGSEAAACGWNGRALVIELDNGTLLWAASDEEGNCAGALHTSLETLPVIPRLPV